MITSPALGAAGLSVAAVAFDPTEAAGMMARPFASTSRAVKRTSSSARPSDTVVCSPLAPSMSSCALIITGCVFKSGSPLATKTSNGRRTERASCALCAKSASLIPTRKRACFHGSDGVPSHFFASTNSLLKMAPRHSSCTKTSSLYEPSAKPWTSRSSAGETWLIPLRTLAPSSNTSTYLTGRSLTCAKMAQCSSSMARMPRWSPRAIGASSTSTPAARHVIGHFNDQYGTVLSPDALAP
mmetsp:Transcript_40505/g.94577  ORF Transcript_40505/g.94577 Transcript_40505/m.94577 type:complete len:241 (-) Transcript_40505:852-1574(-)